MKYIILILLIISGCTTMEVQELKQPGIEEEPLSLEEGIEKEVIKVELPTESSELYYYETNEEYYLDDSFEQYHKELVIEDQEFINWMIKISEQEEMSTEDITYLEEFIYANEEEEFFSFLIDLLVMAKEEISENYTLINDTIYYNESLWLSVSPEIKESLVNPEIIVVASESEDSESGSGNTRANLFLVEDDREKIKNPYAGEGTLPSRFDYRWGVDRFRFTYLISDSWAFRGNIEFNPLDTRVNTATLSIRFTI